MRMLDLVINGKKPGCFFSLRGYSLDEIEKITKLIRKKNLEFFPSRSAWGRKKFTSVQYAIGQKKKCQEIFREKELICIPELKKRIRKLIVRIQNKTIARALVFLDGYPRIDRKYQMIKLFNLEKPEVAFIEGILLGYKDCCIEYYIQTRYLGKFRNLKAESRQKEIDINQYFGVRCPRCTSNNK